MSSLPHDPDQQTLGPAWDDDLRVLGRDLARLLARRWLDRHQDDVVSTPAETVPPPPLTPSQQARARARHARRRALEGDR